MRSFQAFTISMPNDLWRAARPSMRPSLFAGNLQLPSHVNEGLEDALDPLWDLPCKTAVLTSRVSGARWALISVPRQLVHLLATSCFTLVLCYLLHSCLLQRQFEHLWSSWSTLSCHHLNTVHIKICEGINCETLHFPNWNTKTPCTMALQASEFDHTSPLFIEVRLCWEWGDQTICGWWDHCEH